MRFSKNALEIDQHAHTCEAIGTIDDVGKSSSKQMNEVALEYLLS
jgi:hypothetical protein